MLSDSRRYSINDYQLDKCYQHLLSYPVDIVIDVLVSAIPQRNHHPLDKYFYQNILSYPVDRNYRIYLIKHPGCLMIFGLSRRALIRGERLFEAGRLLNFHHFQ